MTAPGAGGPAATRAVSVIAGGGIGPGGMGGGGRVLGGPGPAFRLEECQAGNEVVSRLGTNLPRETIESVLRNGVALKGPTETKIGGGLPSANVGLRKSLDLYASLRPVKSVPSVKTRYEGVDLVVVR